jgi:hypothetical protein
MDKGGIYTLIFHVVFAAYPSRFKNEKNPVDEISYTPGDPFS